MGRAPISPFRFQGRAPSLKKTHRLLLQAALMPRMSGGRFPRTHPNDAARCGDSALWDTLVLRPDNYGYFGGPSMRRFLGATSEDSRSYPSEKQRRNRPGSGLPPLIVSLPTAAKLMGKGRPILTSGVVARRLHTYRYARSSRLAGSQNRPAKIAIIIRSEH